MDGSTQDTVDTGHYRVLARKYRPESFADLIGQEPMVRTLTNAFETGRIAQAYMLTGVRGVGKTTTARILARALNYSIPGEVDKPTIAMDALGEHCAAIMEGRHIDVIEMDAASHTGIDDIREIIEAARYKPAVARYKVYIIDEVHMLSKAAFNGLLKTLEEPPEHVKFIFATTEIRKVPVTVLSRCQRFDLRRIEAGRLIDLMRGIAGKEGIEIEDEALVMLARAAEGSARDSLSLLDQAIAHASGTVEAEAVRGMLGLADRALVIDLFDDLMRGDIAAALGRLRALYDVGADPAVVLEDLAAFTHLVTRLKLAPDTAADDGLTEAEKTRGQAFAEKLSLRVLARAWQMLLKGIDEARAASRPLAAADMVLVRIAHAADLPTPDEALRAVRDTPPQGAGPALSAQPQSAPQSSPAASPGGQGAARLSAVGGGSATPAATPAPSPELPPAPTDDAPKSLAGDLSRKLEEWTGRRWMVAVAREADVPTIAETRRSARARMVDDARADPVVAAVMARFPGAEIVNVRVRAEEEAPLPGSGDEDYLTSDEDDD